MKINTLKCLTLLYSLASFGNLAWSQEVNQVNGRLVFPSVAAYEIRYDQLSADIDRALDDATEIKSGELYDSYPTLADFEKRNSFNSLRQADLQSEYQQLQRGASPESVVKSWFVDPIAAALVNSNFVIQIADTIFILRNERIAIKILKANERILNSILSGTKPESFGEGVIVTDRGPTGNPEDGCDGFVANFIYPISFLTGNTGQLKFSGTIVGSNVKYTWNFGDNTPVSNEISPVHTYAAKGTYNVCLTIQNDEGCYSSKCKLVLVNLGCFSDFDDNPAPGIPGNMCFVDKSYATSAIVSYQWTFGDGGTSTEANPCHVFPCDGNYQVSLQITTATGCKNTSTESVRVSSYYCCDDDVDEYETKKTFEYETGKKIVCSAYVWKPWIGKDKVVGNMSSYKKSLGVWFGYKTKLKVVLSGFMYQSDGQGCACIIPYNISCEDSSNSAKDVKASRKLNQASSTQKGNEWTASFYHKDKLIYFIPAPTGCN